MLSCAQIFCNPWTVGHQFPPSRGFPRQEYWSGLSFSSPGDLPKGLNHISCTAGGLFTTKPPEKPFQLKIMNLNLKLTVRGFPEISQVSLEDLLSHCARYFIPSLPSYLSNSLLFLHFQRMTPMHGNHRREFLSFFLYQPYNSIYLLYPPPPPSATSSIFLSSSDHSKQTLQYFGHLMRRVDSLQKTLMLRGIGGRRRRG